MATPPPTRQRTSGGDPGDGQGASASSGSDPDAVSGAAIADVSAAETLLVPMKISDLETDNDEKTDIGIGAVASTPDAARTRRLTVNHESGDEQLPPGLGAPDVPVERVSEPAIVLPLMPAPDAIPLGHPDEPWPPPGQVPAGDSRSLRRGDGAAEEFALVYREGAVIITRFGVVGRRGQWRVVEYPNIGAASHAYAKECSRWAADGYVDYRGP